MSSELSLPTLLLLARHSDMSPNGSAEMDVRYAMSCSGLSFILAAFSLSEPMGVGPTWTCVATGAVLPRLPLDVGERDLLFSVLDD